MFDPFAYIIKRRDRGVYGNKIRAQVVENKDPDGRGRIKARARDLHDNFPDDHLPWSGPHEGFGAGVAGSGKKDIPPIGSYVFLGHQDDSLYHPHYYDGPATDDKQIPELNENTPGHVDRGGNLHSKSFGENNDQNIITDQHQSGTTQKIDTDGSVTHQNVKNKTETTYGDTHLIQGDDKTVLHIKFKKVMFDCDEIIMKKPQDGGQYKKPDDNKPGARKKPTFNKPSGDTY